MKEDSIRVIKISREALFEFIYEQFITEQERLFDVDALDVMDTFDIDWENGQFIFCVHKSENENGDIIPFPKEINMSQLMSNLPDTTASMYSPNGKCYREYKKSDLIKLSQG